MQKPCPHCGKLPRKKDKFCPECGTKLNTSKSSILRGAYCLLAISTGTLGIHNLYAGFYARGIVQLLFTIIGILYFHIYSQYSALVFPVISFFWSIAEAFRQKKDACGFDMQKTNTLSLIKIFFLIAIILTLFYFLIYNFYSSTNK